MWQHSEFVIYTSFYCSFYCLINVHTIYFVNHQNFWSYHHNPHFPHVLSSVSYTHTYLPNTNLVAYEKRVPFLQIWDACCRDNGHDEPPLKSHTTLPSHKYVLTRRFWSHVVSAVRLRIRWKLTAALRDARRSRYKSIKCVSCMG